MPAGAGSDASARGGDEQPSFEAALTTARNHSAGPGVVTWREEEPEEVEQEMYDGPRAQNTPPPGTRPEQLLAAPGPGLLRSSCRRWRRTTGSTDATLQFLLLQSLLAVAAEEEAKEVAKLREEEVAVQEQLVLEELNRLARLRDKTNLSHQLGRANGWALAEKALLKVTTGPGRYTNTGRAAPVLPQLEF